MITYISVYFKSVKYITLKLILNEALYYNCSCNTTNKNNTIYNIDEIKEVELEQLSFSKINIGLAILDKRDDGYHNIDTIFQSIYLGDSIYFAKHHSVVFSGSMPDLPKSMQEMVLYDESNLALKALRAVQAYTKCKLGGAIHLLKRVPPGAGLGGGSGDAAAMIKGLNKFWDLRLTAEEMLNLAKPLGADVAFLLSGGTARGRGKGDQLVNIASPEIAWLLVVNPHVHIATNKAYSLYSGKTSVDSQHIDDLENDIKNNELKKAFAKAKNTFEEILFPEYSELQKCYDFFVKRGYSALMSGSGSSIVVYLDKAKEALDLQEEIKKAGYNWLSLITKTKLQEEI